MTILQREFGARRKDLLGDRTARLERLNAGERPDFLPETRDIRMSEWNVATLPRDLLDRRVEITGPVDQKMIINALNIGRGCSWRTLPRMPAFTQNFEVWPRARGSATGMPDIR